METPEREQNSTSEPSEDPDRILVEKVVIPVSDTVKQDPVKKTSALKQGEVADDCCSTSESSEDPDQILVEKVIIPVSDTAKQDPVKKTSALKEGEVAHDCCREQKLVVGQEGPQDTKRATKTKSEFSIEKIKNSDNLMKLYTGCPNYQIFLFFFFKQSKAKSLETVKPQRKNSKQ